MSLPNSLQGTRYHNVGIGTKSYHYNVNRHNIISAEVRKQSILPGRSAIMIIIIISIIIIIIIINRIMKSLFKEGNSVQW